MAFASLFEEQKRKWLETDPKFRWAILTVIVACPVLMFLSSRSKDDAQKDTQTQKVEKAARDTGGGAKRDPNHPQVSLPSTPRNQGLEDLTLKLDQVTAQAKASEDRAAAAEQLAQKMSDRLSALENHPNGGVGTNGKGQSSDAVPNVSFDQPGGKGPAGADKFPAGDDFNLAPPGAGSGGQHFADVPKTAPTTMHVFQPVASKKADDSVDRDYPPILIPVNSALESVMLVGIDARSNAAGSAPAGSVLSPANVGSPFVTRVKGDAILPNRFRVSELGDCFVGGHGIGILSTGRANVISSMLSCVRPDGTVYEGEIKAYGVDLDGIQGIAGRVVTKQGAILARTFMAGIASGLGTALSPQAIPGYNSNVQSGSQQGIQYANPSLVAQTAVGTGFSSASSQLSKFYLDYAKEMFPIVEVDAGTRITWILEESIELKATHIPSRSKSQ